MPTTIGITHVRQKLAANELVSCLGLDQTRTPNVATIATACGFDRCNRPVIALNPAPNWACTAGQEIAEDNPFSLEPSPRSSVPQWAWAHSDRPASGGPRGQNASRWALAGCVRTWDFQNREFPTREFQTWLLQPGGAT